MEREEAGLQGGLSNPPRAEVGMGTTAHLARACSCLPPPHPWSSPAADPSLFPSLVLSHGGYWATARQTRPLTSSSPLPSSLPNPIPISWVTQLVGTLNASHHLADLHLTRLLSSQRLLFLLPSAARSHRRQAPLRTVSRVQVHAHAAVAHVPIHAPTAEPSMKPSRPSGPFPQCWECVPHDGMTLPPSLASADSS